MQNTAKQNNPDSVTFYDLASKRGELILQWFQAHMGQTGLHIMKLLL